MSNLLMGSGLPAAGSPHEGGPTNTTDTNENTGGMHAIVLPAARVVHGNYFVSWGGSGSTALVSHAAALVSIAVTARPHELAASCSMTHPSTGSRARSCDPPGFGSATLRAEPVCLRRMPWMSRRAGAVG